MKRHYTFQLSRAARGGRGKTCQRRARALWREETLQLLPHWTPRTESGNGGKAVLKEND